MRGYSTVDAVVHFAYERRSRRFGGFVWTNFVHFTCEYNMMKRNDKAPAVPDLSKAADEMSLLVVGMSRPELDDHLDHQMRVDAGERRWLFRDPYGDRQIVVCRTSTAFKKARAELQKRFDCAQASESDLSLLVETADSLQVWDSADMRRIDEKTARQIDRKLNEERFGEVKQLLESAISARAACHFLELRDAMCGGDVDLFLANDWPLEQMPWAVDIHLDWTEALVCHSDGMLIFNHQGQWDWLELEESWREHCGVVSNDALAPDDRAKLAAWLDHAAAWRQRCR